MPVASDDEDDAPMPDAPAEPELIDMPPSGASHCPWCTALDRAERVSLLSHVSVVLCVLPQLVSPRPDHQTGLQTVTDKKILKNKSFIVAVANQGV